MEIGFLVKTGAALMISLFLLILFVLVPKNSKKKPKQKKEKKEEQKIEISYDDFSFDDLRALVRNRKISNEDLSKVVDAILKNYSHIPNKMGIRKHPDFDKYVDFIVHLVRHPNTSKELILKVDKELRRINPSYEKELNDALSMALKSLGV